MNVLKTAMEKQQWELAAYTMILAAARVIGTGDKDEKKDREKK